MCLWAIIYSQDRSTYFPAAEYADQSWEYMNRSQTHECGNWDWGRAIPFLGIVVSNFRYCVFAVYVTLQVNRDVRWVLQNISSWRWILSFHIIWRLWVKVRENTALVQHSVQRWSKDRWNVCMVWQHFTPTVYLATRGWTFSFPSRHTTCNRANQYWGRGACFPKRNGRGLCYWCTSQSNSFLINLAPPKIGSTNTT
jgi:hypothetical protein